MTTAEIAAKYGVPTPETCKELNWENIDTNFYWLICDNTQKVLLHIIQENRYGEKCYHPVNGGFAHNKFKIYPAPQFHEMAPLLYLFNFELNKMGSEQRLLYRLDETPYFGSYKILTGNYAQAAAELYLQLKS